MLSVGDQATEEEEDDHSPGTTESHSKDMSPDESELDSEAKLMRSMGLPIQFGRVSAHKSFEVLIYFYYFYVLLFKKKKQCNIIYFYLQSDSFMVRTFYSYIITKWQVGIGPMCNLNSP